MFTSNKAKTVLLVLLLVGILLIVGSVSATAPYAYRSNVYVHPARQVVDMTPSAIVGAKAELFTTPEGATIHYRTSDLEPWHVYDLWWVIVNKPEACSAYPGPCTDQDITDRSNTVQPEIAHAASALVFPGGHADFEAMLPVGPIENGWYSNGLTNPQGAEIHLILTDHGYMLQDGTQLQAGGENLEVTNGGLRALEHLQLYQCASFQQ